MSSFKLELYHAAKEGSTVALAALSSLAALDPSAFHDVVAAVRHQLRCAGPQYTSVASSKRFDIATGCFKSLWTALGSENSKVLRDPSNVTLLAETWPELCSWIVEYLKFFVVEASMTPELQDFLATSKTLDLLHLLLENDSLLHLMIQSLDLISCLTEISMCLLFTETPLPSQYLPTMQIILKLGRRDEITSRDARAAVGKTLDAMHSARITMVLFRIIRLTEHPAMSSSEINTVLSFLSCCSASSSKFHANHLIHGSVSWICGMLSRMLKCSYAHRQHARSCALYLRHCIEKGPRWAAQAVERHLVELLLKALPHASDDFTNVISGLFDSIHVHLLFRGVLRHVCRSIERIERLGLDSQLANASVSARETWEAFKEVAEDRWVWRDVVASKGEFHECSNHMCMSTESPPPVRRCQGCLNVFYCSRDCQKKDWHAHKTDCQNVQQERREGFSPQLSQRDLHFIRFVAIQDIKTADDVRDALAKRVASVNNGFFPVVVVDYTTAPRSITVALMGRDHLHAEWPEAMEQLGTQEQLVRIIISSDGGEEFEIFTATTLE
ncbi:uncharacterized protein EV420DRAFT_1564888 [Desarmillaria tabescens]|uniref:MYND-type domain-containing protein n=1 Tax=Armillaria tabescens TaxID=1929756 RepID=A0AA39JVY0_ARMTA|nr:uncharacterized protein EV420DRAFT_1564888 [Desarmillaria tabescens]KAK0449592.1 hypothetical protein EV420DRAFT_1564888 [Desarmillaria tabescens]